MPVSQWVSGGTPYATGLTQWGRISHWNQSIFSENVEIPSFPGDGSHVWLKFGVGSRNIAGPEERLNMNDKNILTALIGLLAEAVKAYTENEKFVAARFRAEDAQNKMKKDNLDWEKENYLLNETTEMCFDWDFQQERV